MIASSMISSWSPYCKKTRARPYLRWMCGRSCICQQRVEDAIERETHSSSIRKVFCAILAQLVQPMQACSSTKTKRS